MSDRAARRRAAREARKPQYPPAFRCPYCDQVAGLLLELCPEGCCEPQQACANCLVPIPVTA